MSTDPLQEFSGDAASTVEISASLEDGAVQIGFWRKERAGSEVAGAIRLSPIDALSLADNLRHLALAATRGRVTHTGRLVTP